MPAFKGAYKSTYIIIILSQIVGKRSLAQVNGMILISRPALRRGDLSSTFSSLHSRRMIEAAQLSVNGMTLVSRPA